MAATYVSTRTTFPRLSATRLTTPVCLLAAMATAACFFVLGFGAPGGSGADMLSQLGQHATRYQVASILAIWAAAGLGVAAARLGRRIGGDAGRLATAAGVTVAFLMAAYYSAYAAGVAVSQFVLDESGAGVGESSLVLLNLIELARYAPGLVLVGAVLVARRSLPRAITVPAWVLLVAMIFPMTTWAAAILTPVWLGVAGALAGRRGTDH